MYSPTEFGYFSTFNATASILAVLLPLSFPLSIPNATTDTEAKYLAHISVAATLVMASISALVLTFVGMAGALPRELSEIYPTILLTPVLGALIAVTQTQRYLLLRNQKYFFISGLVAMNSGISNVLKITLGAFYSNFFVLLGSVIFASLLQFIAGWKYLIKIKTGGSLNNLTSFLRYCKVIQRNRSFPIYRMPQDLLATISQSLPVLLLAAFFGPEQAAFYAICKLALEAPSRLVGSAIRDVLYSKISNSRRTGGKVYSYVAMSTLAIAIAAIIPMVTILVWAPDIFRIVFGEKWRASGEMAQVASLMFVLGILNKPSIAAIPILNMNKTLLFYEVFSSSGRALAFMLSALYLQTPLSSVAAYSAVGALFYMVLITKVLVEAKKYDYAKAG